MRSWIPIGALTLIISTGVHADGRDDDGDDGGWQFNLSAGAGVSVEQSPYVGGKDDIKVLPLLFVDMGRFYLHGPELGVHLYDDDDLSVSAGVSLDLADTDRGDSPQLADMDELDDVVLGVVGVSYKADWGEVEVSLGADISGTHDGYLAEFSYGYPIEVGGWQIEPEIGVEWHSAEVNRHYYGVNTGNVRPTHSLYKHRPFYQPDAGMNYELSVTATYPFAERHALWVEAGAEWLSTEASDSPIVDRDVLVGISAGYLFRF